MFVVNVKRSCRTTGWLILFLVIGMMGCSGEDVKETEERSTVEETAEGIWEDVQDLYNKAREKGEKVPESTYDWIRQDLQGMGDWQYQVVDIQETDPEILVGMLNELGRDRWECIFIEPYDTGRRFYFKKPVRVYLKNIPLSDILKMIPGGGDGE